MKHKRKKKPPKKPTQTFGSVHFGKDGSTKPVFDRLNDVKDAQELQVVERFIERLTAVDLSLGISLNAQLGEADHDFAVRIGGIVAEPQLTELVDREFLEPTTEDELRKGRWTELIVKARGEAPWGVNIEARNQALTSAVARKVEKRYATVLGTPLLLVVFSTCPYPTQSMQEGKLHLSEGLCRARRYLAAVKSQPFEQVWYFNLLSSPVKVWPCSADGFESTPEPPLPAGTRRIAVTMMPAAMEVVPRPRP